jgi:hypothetical protein
MNDELDELEAELKSLAPCALSEPLKARIAARLVQQDRKSAIWQRAAYVASVACIAAVLTLSALRFEPRTRPSQLAHKSVVQPRPTIWNYRAAMASPERLDELLESHAQTLLPASTEKLRTHRRTLELNLNPKG